MDLLDLPTQSDILARARSYTNSTHENDSLGGGSISELGRMSRGPSVYIKRGNKASNGIQRYRLESGHSMAPADMTPRRTRVQRRISQKIVHANAARASQLVQLIEAQDDPLGNGTAWPSDSNPLNLRPTANHSNSVCVVSLEDLEKQFAWQDRPLSKFGQFLDRVHLDVLPCCRADDESLGHHVSIFLVAILSFSTMICLTIILLLVYIL